VITPIIGGMEVEGSEPPDTLTPSCLALGSL